ncbi:MAG: Tol-Pal system beta propeller repeat protein TolB [Burkholderiales bacterium]|nr:Tol-Pal system beta propeller repeat protein TolB [Burkholderiales bacterium]
MERLFRILAICLALLATAAHAQLTIEITGAGGNQIPVAVVPFAGESALTPAISDVIEADLARSGRFRTLYTGPQNLSDTSTVDFAPWRGKNADALVVGGVYPVGGGRFEARFRLYDVPKQAQLGALAFTLTVQQARATAHRIADFVYEKLTGERGVFSTRIAYVVKNGARYQLQIADADGANAQAALSSLEPIISPAWSPDGSRLAYVSFENKKPVVYVHSLASGKRQAVANFRGSNSAPAWSPDGRSLAVVLSREGGSQLFLMNADGSGARRLLSSSAIDTEPFYAPDGQSIYFTSDRGGSPQIYRVAAAGGPVERLTFDGSYNVTPRPSPDGKYLAFVRRDGGRFQVSVMDLASRQVRALTDTGRDESPSFAPNGRMILYATQVSSRGVLAAVSSDGGVKQRLSVPAGDVREPAWGPFLN